MRYSVGSGLGPGCNSRYIRTCCDMAAAMPWRTRATTHGRCKHGSGTRTSSTRCAIPSWHRIDLRTSGDEKLLATLKGIGRELEGLYVTQAGPLVRSSASPATPATGWALHTRLEGNQPGSSVSSLFQLGFTRHYRTSLSPSMCPLGLPRPAINWRRDQQHRTCTSNQYQHGQ
jgi:hypothetical protein